MPGCRTINDVLGAGSGVRINRDSPQATGLVSFRTAAVKPSMYRDTIRPATYYATAAGSISQSVDSLGPALYMDGASGSYLDCGIDPALNFTSGNFTIASYLKIVSIADGDVFWSRGTYGDVGFYFQVYAHKFTFASLTDLTQGTLDPLGLTGWHKFIVVKNGTAISFYLDGVLDPNTTSGSHSPASNTSTSLKLGSYSDGTLAPEMKWFEFAAWNRALSAPEVWSLYDPRTRYDLFWVPRRSAPKKAAAGGGGGVVSLQHIYRHVAGIGA